MAKKGKTQSKEKSQVPKKVQQKQKEEEQQKQQLQKDTGSAPFCPCTVVFSILIALISLFIGYIMLSGATEVHHSILQNLDSTTRLPPNFLGIDGTFYKSNVTDLYIHYKEWAPNKNAKVYEDPNYNIDDEQMHYPRAIVVISPGRFLHSGSGFFDSFASRLAEEGAVAVFAFDQPGFGKSEGDRGYAESFDALLNESENFVKMARSKYPNIPTVCLGEDISAYTMAQLSYKRDLFNSEKVNDYKGKNVLCNGVAMFAPPSFGIVEKMYFKVNFVKKIIDFMAEKLPKMPVPIFYTNSMLTTDKSVASIFGNDKFTSRFIKMRTFKMMMDARMELFDHPEKIKSTLEIVHGMNDTLTDDAYNQAIIAGASHVFKSASVIEKAKHFLVADKEVGERTYDEFSDWLRLAIYNMVDDFVYEDDD